MMRSASRVHLENGVTVYGLIDAHVETYIAYLMDRLGTFRVRVHVGPLGFPAGLTGWRIRP